MNNRYVKTIGLLFFCLNIVPFIFSQTIDCGRDFTFFVCENGRINSWGVNYEGALGAGSLSSNSDIPLEVLNLTNVSSVAGGWNPGYAVKTDGTAWSWGHNSSGQLGNGTTTSSNVPVQIVGLTNVVKISAGWKHAVALKNDGTVWAWGDNISCQLGTGAPCGSSSSSNIPVQVSGLTNIIDIASGDSHTLALKSDGTVWVWGKNADYQYGNGLFTVSTTPVQVPSLTNITSIGAGFRHSLAVSNDGSLYVWGGGGFGELGLGNNNSSSVPAQVNGMTDVNSVATVSGNFSLVLKNDGSVWSWGYNNYGQLGNGSSTSSNVPVPVQGLTDVTEISGGYEFAVAVKSDGTVWSWGNDNNGQLGNGVNSTASNVPVQVMSLCSGALGVDDEFKFEISVYPNPVSDKLIIHSESSVISYVQLKDASGKLIYESTMNSSTLEIDLTDFETGVYFVDCLVGGEILREKITVTN